MLKTKIITIALFVLIYFTVQSPQEYGFIQEGAVWKHFTYPFFHASFLHLILNCYLFYTLFKDPVIKPIYLLLLIYFVSSLASFISCVTVPTIGSSGAIFALGGVSIAQRATPKNILLSMIAILITFILKGSNPYIHLYSWLGGFLGGLFIKLIRTYKNDIKGSYIRKQP